MRLAAVLWWRNQGSYKLARLVVRLPAGSRLRHRQQGCVRRCVVGSVFPDFEFRCGMVFAIVLKFIIGITGQDGGGRLNVYTLEYQP